MAKPVTPRLMLKTIAIIALIVAVLAALYFWIPQPKHPTYVEGRPLLELEGPTFADPQIGLTLSPPKNWSLQARSIESPTHHRPERLVVKFKRLIPGQPVAWLRVRVADAPPDQTPADLLRKRKPDEPEWKVTKEVEEGLTLAGRPAARITFGGPFNPDGRGKRDFTCEMIAVRRGQQVIYLAGTFATPDKKAREQIQTALDSVVLE